MAAVKLDSSVDILKGPLMLFIGDNPLAFEKSSKLSTNTDEIDVSNKMMGDWAGSLAGKKSFSFSSDSLTTKKTGACSYDTLLDAQIAGTPLNFKFAPGVSADKDAFGGTFTPDTTQRSYTGKAIITSLEITSEAGTLVTCSATLKGVGALVPVEGVPAQGS
jgi:Phage major tail protein 2.